MLTCFVSICSDLKKTSRERHVTHKLYAFFIFNNLIIFSIFSTIWELIARIVGELEKTGNETKDVWKVIQDYKVATQLTAAIFKVSPFWMMYLLQRYVYKPPEKDGSKSTWSEEANGKPEIWVQCWTWLSLYPCFGGLLRESGCVQRRGRLLNIRHHQRLIMLLTTIMYVFLLLLRFTTDGCLSYSCE